VFEALEMGSWCAGLAEVASVDDQEGVVCDGRFWSSPELGGFDLMWLTGWFQNVVLKLVRIRQRRIMWISDMIREE
jgi:hypothetical protein